MFELFLRLCQPGDLAEGDQLVPLQVKTELSPATVTNLVVEDSVDHDEGDGDDNDHLSPLAAHQHRSSQVTQGEEAEDLKSR